MDRKQTSIATVIDHMLASVQIREPRIRVPSGIVVAQIEITVGGQAVSDHDIVRLIPRKSKVRRDHVMVPGIHQRQARCQDHCHRGVFSSSHRPSIRLGRSVHRRHLPLPCRSAHLPDQTGRHQRLRRVSI